MSSDFLASEKVRNEIASIGIEIKGIVERLAAISKQVSLEMKEHVAQQYKEKHMVSVGDIVIWKGVRAKIVDLEENSINISIIVTGDKTSSVVHKIKNIKEISHETQSVKKSN